MTAPIRQIRVGADIGGTFTDVVLEVNDTSYSAKILTDHSFPEMPIIEGVKLTCRAANIDVGAVGMVIHGTTLVTNALIERRGARTAFITTKGFRDVLEMRTESRFEQYDLNIVLPSPLIARNDRFVIEERINSRGEILKILDAADVQKVIDDVIGGNYESIAIGFIHSYANGSHERKIRDRILARRPEIAISISSEVSPQIREYPRFNTVCANAYVMPAISAYLRRLVERFRQEGIGASVFLIHSGGGIITIDDAARFPVRLLESGPAGGAIFAAHLASQYHLDKVLSYDMGGTTAKVCLIEHQAPKTAHTFEVARTYRFKKGSGMPITIPVIEMVEIGAGGGSIAHIDNMRQIRVGPHSAGSEPGPACYGRGGDRPTVTDADLLLGKIDPLFFAGGKLKLSRESAERAVQARIGGPLAIDSAAGAFGICEVVDENMANAARMHAVENGKELGQYTMIAFGGAAPLHAARLGEKLGIGEILIPPGAGVGSAIGFLRAPFGFEAVRTSYCRLTRFDAPQINTLIADLQQEAVAVVKAARPEAVPQCQCVAYMRYVGQGWEIPVAIDIRPYAAADAQEFLSRFQGTYAQHFGRAIDTLDVEIVSWSLRASSSDRTKKSVVKMEASADARVQATRPIFDARIGQFLETGVFHRNSLAPGMRIAGPAAIVEDETTTIVTASFEAILQRDRSLLLRRIAS